MVFCAGSSMVSRKGRSKCIHACMTNPNFWVSLEVGPNPQALAAASKVARYSVIDLQEWQSSTEYRVVVNLASASEGGGRNRASRASQIGRASGREREKR